MRVSFLIILLLILLASDMAWRFRIIPEHPFTVTLGQEHAFQAKPDGVSRSGTIVPPLKENHHD